MRYLATESGLALAEREPMRVMAPELWIPRDSSIWELPPVKAFGVAGGFATTQMAGGVADLWQPLGIPGFILDLDPRFNLSTDSSSGFPRVSAFVNTVASRSDSFANSNDSLRPLFEPAGWVGARSHPSILFDGGNDYLLCSSSLAADLFGGNDTAFTIFLVGEFQSTAGTQAPICASKLVGTQPFWDFYLTSGPTYGANKRGDSGSLASVAGGTANTAKHIFECVQFGTSVDITVDGVSVASGAQDVPSMTADAVTLGATFVNSAPANWANIRIARAFGFVGALASPYRTTVRTTLQALYF